MSGARWRSIALCWSSALILQIVALPAFAQDEPRVRVGAGLSKDLLVGKASDFLDGGDGRFLLGDFRLGAGNLLSVRVDGSWSSLVDDEDEFAGSRAENDVLILAVGPQLTATLGRFRPYAAALAGFTTVVWHTEVDTFEGEIEDDGSESGMAWGGHAGLGFTLDRGDHPVVVQLEARLLDAGEFAFARAPDVIRPEAPVGLLRQDFAAFSLRLAFTLGF